MEINDAFLQISGQHASTTSSADGSQYPHDRYHLRRTVALRENLPHTGIKASIDELS